MLCSTNVSWRSSCVLWPWRQARWAGTHPRDCCHKTAPWWQVWLFQSDLGRLKNIAWSLLLVWPFSFIFVPRISWPGLHSVHAAGFHFSDISRATNGHLKSVDNVCMTSLTRNDYVCCLLLFLSLRLIVARIALVGERDKAYWLGMLNALQIKIADWN